MVGDAAAGDFTKGVGMQARFEKVHERGYGVTVEGPDIDAATMNPAPGYHDRLPHDAAHFIVENELGIEGGVFGQLAAGGTANTFHLQGSKKPRKVRRRGAAMMKANKEDALFSEQAVWAAQSRWEKLDIIPDTNIPRPDLDRIIASFEAFAAKWSELPPGSSITLEWKHKTRKRSR